ncbi:MAG TPA: class I SAM-dependent rRNA methyltransferase [Gammaproteobacteria bacterium]|nr:class I SAM-dependent rRNA methyltransferase [Gammaproteobacteria bacterium]
MELAELFLKKDEERRIRAGHLWVFSNEVDTARSALQAFEPGQPVRILAHDGRFLGSGYVNPHSLIAARILSRDPEHPPGESLLVHRLNVALSLRERFYARPFYRLAFGESDGLPGLIVDRYGNRLAVQITTAGMEALRGAVVTALQRVLAPRGILLRNDQPVRELERLERYVETIGEMPETLDVPEGDGVFRVSPHRGQKTGWFYDQADNRARLAPYVRGRSVLDLFSYVGAWGLGAALSGAERVTCVDSSGPALELLLENARRNRLDPEVLEGDAFDVLKALRADRRHFDVVIADPPAFVQRRKDFRRGAEAYRRLNRMALQVTAPDGFLISGSCSHHMPGDAFLQGMQAGARHLDRVLQLLERRGQSLDHPVHPAIPETAYLKMFYARVLRT